MILQLHYCIRAVCQRYIYAIPKAKIWGQYKNCIKNCVLCVCVCVRKELKAYGIYKYYPILKKRENPAIYNKMDL